MRYSHITLVCSKYLPFQDYRNKLIRFNGLEPKYIYSDLTLVLTNGDEAFSAAVNDLFLSNGHSPANLSNSSTRRKFASLANSSTRQNGHFGRTRYIRPPFANYFPRTRYIRPTFANNFPRTRYIRERQIYMNLAKLASLANLASVD